MPKRRTHEQFAAAVAAGPPPASTYYTADCDWWDAQDEWVAKAPTGMGEHLATRGNPQRRKDWQRITKQHAALLKAEPRFLSSASSSDAVTPAPQPLLPPLPPPSHLGPEWQWDDDWCCYYNVKEAEASNIQEAQMEAQVQQLCDASDFVQVRDWLEDLIVELEPPSYSMYEVNRQRTIVRNEKILLGLSQAALRDASLVDTSRDHLAFLKQECCKAEARVAKSVHDLNRIEQHVCP